MKLFKKTLCDICKKKFSREEDRMNHMQIMHSNELQYDCKACNRFFSNMEDMRSHLQKEHSYKKDR